MIIAGIDPAHSKSHVMAIFNSGKLAKVVKGDLRNIYFNVHLWEVDKVYIEDQFLGRNPKVLKNLAQSTGKILGLLDHYAIEYELVEPIVWQTYFDLPKKPRKSKENPVIPTRYQWEKMHYQHIIKMAKDMENLLDPLDVDEASAILIGLWGINHDRT